MAARYRDRDATVGNLSQAGAHVPNEMPAEYAGLITDVILATPYSADQIIAAHRQRNASRAAPRPAIQPFIRRSLRRI